MLRKNYWKIRALFGSIHLRVEIAFRVKSFDLEFGLVFSSQNFRLIFRSRNSRLKLPSRNFWVDTSKSILPSWYFQVDTSDLKIPTRNSDLKFWLEIPTGKLWLISSDSKVPTRKFRFGILTWNFELKFLLDFSESKFRVKVLARSHNLWLESIVLTRRWIDPSCQK